MEMMRKHDALTQEDGFHLLLPRAHEYVPQLMAAFEIEKDRGDSGLGFWLLELLAEAKSPEAFPLFAACLRSDHALLRIGAIYGLHKLDTKDARRLLWEARSYTFATEEDTQFFREDLDHIVRGSGA